MDSVRPLNNIYLRDRKRRVDLLWEVSGDTPFDENSQEFFTAGY